MAKIGIVRIKKLVDALLDFAKVDYESKIVLGTSLVHTTDNGIGIKKKDTITLTGTIGKSTLTIGSGLTKIITFHTNLTVTASDFVTANSAYYLTLGIVLSSSTNKLILEAQTAGISFISPVIGDIIQESFLYRCFDSDDIIEGVDYTKLAVDIFTRLVTDSRKVETRLLFDPDRASLPTIHVREPSKSKGKQDGIGYIGEGFYENADLSFQEERRRSFDSQFELMITSMNRHEVVVMEEVMLGLLIGAQDSLAIQEPFYNINFVVKELIANNELIPNPLFIKSIMINVSYDKTYPDISNNELLTSILFEQLLLT
jgi:hypothetical protein